MRISHFAFSLLIAFLPVVVSAHEIVIWNVGQGSWATVSGTGTCDHFDMGGEFAPWSEVEALCRDRLNRLHFSHWDWDHISFTMTARAKFKNICLADAPLGDAPGHRQSLINGLAKCTAVTNVSEITPHFETRPEKMSANDRSRIFVAGSIALFPGDSPRRKNLESRHTLTYPSEVARSWSSRQPNFNIS